MNTFIDSLDLSANTKKQYKSSCKTTGVTLETSIAEIERMIPDLSPLKASSILSVFKYLHPESQVIRELLVENRKKRDMHFIPNKELPEFLPKKEMEKIIKTFSINYQFLFQLLINHEVLRMADYHNIKISDVHRGTLTISDPVKVSSIPIKIKLIQKEKNLLKQLTTDKIFDISYSLFEKQSIELCRKLGLKSGGISSFRKYYSVTHPDDISAVRRVTEVAKNQNHSLSTFMSYYS